MNGKPKLLIIEDDARIARQLKWALVDDYDIDLAKNSSSAMKKLMTKKPEVITLDLGLPPRPQEAVVGLKLLGQIIQCEP
ncbi:MAG: AAA family ATPase, partial [Deltaproteobacteria bacterium]|nr:AAA family ATPase [Deltaproteobacteria bacterium]